MLDRRIQFFMMVADAGSILAASKRLYMSQPSLSQQINSLEKDLGVELFERTSRGVRLTSAGERFYREFQAINKQINSIIESTRESISGSGEVVRIGGDRKQRDIIMSDMLVEFKRRYHDADVTYVTLKMEDIPPAIAEGRIDVATYWQSPMAREYKCRWDLVRVYNVGVCVPVTHPLASKPALSLHDIEGMTVALSPYGHFDACDAIRNEICSSPYMIKLADVDDDEVPEHYLIRGWLPLVPYPYLFERPNIHAIRLEIPQTIPVGILSAQEHSPIIDSFVEIAREACNLALAAESNSQD